MRMIHPTSAGQRVARSLSIGKIPSGRSHQFHPGPIPSTMQGSKLTRLGARLSTVALALALLASHAAATILTFEDFTADNVFINALANPFGVGQYGSRANSAINAGFQQGAGWTPNVVLTWSSGWQTYTAWPLGNDAQSGSGDVAQADFAESAGNPLTLTFAPDPGFGVLVKSFTFAVWDSSPLLPVQIEWAVFAGSVAPENQIASGLSAALGAAGGVQTIETGLTEVQSSARPVILRWQLVSGDPTYLAINNVHFLQGPARQAPVLTWLQPDAILVGTILSGTQLNAAADVPGTFVYTPGPGTVLSAGTHALTADFTPNDPSIYEEGRITTTLLVKSSSVPVISVRPPLKIGATDPLTVALFNVSSDVRGIFSLSPPAGTLLPVGTHSISVIFTPESSAFASVSTNVSLTVVPVVPEGTIWNFSDSADRLRPLCGDDELSFYDPHLTGWPASKTAFGSASSFGLPSPEGGDPQVMYFNHANSSEGLKLDFNDPPNGVFQANGWVANYTLVFDLLYPQSSSGTLRPLYNSNLENANAAEAFVSAANPAAVQVLGRSFGEIRANTWHRITLVVRAAPAEGQIHIYVDGTFIGAVGSNDGLISSRYALEDFVYLLTDSVGNGGAGYLSGLRFIGRNLDYFEVKALGGVHAEGPHVAGASAPRPPFQPLRDVVIIGHRGNGGFAPEDTLPSFVSSFALGGDVVEADIRRTFDNRVVVMHDSTVDRTTDGTGSVSSMTLAQLQTLDAGSWFSPAFTGTPPPALRDVMAAVKDTYPNGILYLDCKVNGMAPLIKADCDATGFSPDRLWIWIYDQVGEAAAFRSVFPNVKIIWGEGNWAHRASIFDWPSLNAAQRRLVAKGMKERGVYGFDFGDNEADSLNPATLQELRAEGFFVSLYSTLHPASMTRAINEIGIDGMETDFPGVLRELMPAYTSETSASGASPSAVLVSWTGFHPGPHPRDVQLRAKAKASPAWVVVATGLSAHGGSWLVSGLAEETAYEFQVLGYGPHGRPVAFGSVAEAVTLDAQGNNGGGN
jgi:glycerophosphoryl diester phosphodiesterase